VLVTATNAGKRSTITSSEVVGPVTAKPAVPATVAVPRLIGLTLASAQATASGAGLPLVTNTDRQTKSCFGRVLTQSPAEGTVVPTGHTVYITVPAINLSCYGKYQKPYQQRRLPG
jgi:beta-lactam-binding protein with PASTA domain